MNRAEEQFELSDIITRHLSGEVNENERAKLQVWLEESEQHRRLFERLCSKELAARKVEAYSKINPQGALNELLAEKSRRKHILIRKRVIRTMQYAAILIVAIVGTWYFYGQKRQVAVIAKNEMAVINPGKTKAILTLATGEVMNLSDVQGEQIRHGGPVVIRNDSGRLEYQLADKVTEGKEQYNTIEVPRGGEYALVLSDGTKVWLNAGSRLKYPVAFLEKQRKVYLEGEAYFEVTKDRRHEFVVATRRAAVTVYGTSFNVMDYVDESKMAVTLVQGSVGVEAVAMDKHLMLVPGEQAVLLGENLTKDRVDVNRYIAWRNGKIAYESTPLEDMLRQLSRWYDVDITFAREGAKHILFTGEIIKYEDFDEVLDVISSTNEVKVKMDGRTVIVY